MRTRTQSMRHQDDGAEWEIFLSVIGRCRIVIYSLANGWRAVMMTPWLDPVWRIRYSLPGLPVLIGAVSFMTFHKSFPS